MSLLPLKKSGAYIPTLLAFFKHTNMEQTIRNGERIATQVFIGPSSAGTHENFNKARLERKIKNLESELKRLKHSLKRKTTESYALKDPSARRVYLSSTRSNISYTEGLLRHLKRKLASMEENKKV